MTSAHDRLIEPISTYYGLLRRVHEFRRPATYLEIGVHEGHSLAFAQPGTRIVGVDPFPNVADPPPDCTIVAATSDAFFADPIALHGRPVDLAFIDGLHLWEQALRDFANVEAVSRPDSVILIHDCNPIDEITSSRDRTTVIWSGDVWKTIVAVRRHRSDLTVHTVAVEPTGMAIITGLDPTNTVLLDRFDDIVTEIGRLEYADLVATNHEDPHNLVAPDWALVRDLLDS